MAVKAFNKFVDGNRLLNGTHFNNIFTGAEQMQAISVSGASVLGGTTFSSTGAVSGNNISASGFIRESVGNALTAAGTNQATALALTKQINNITTAAASTGAVLPSVATAGIGARITIFNAGANAIQVYGAGADTIDTIAGPTGVVLTNAKRCDYFAVAAATWVSAQLGVVSA